MEYHTSRDRLRRLLTFACFLLIALLAYSNILTAYFLSDDFAQIGKVYEGDLSVTWGRSHGGFFRPLFILSYFLDAQLWGLNPPGFHLTNVALHATNAFLVTAFAARLIRESARTKNETRFVALAAGLIFLLHPSHTEAVAWISGRADLLATCFSLLALLAFEVFTRTRRITLLLLSFVAFTLALLSKEAAICLPLVMLVFGIYAARKNRDDVTDEQRVTDKPGATTKHVIIAASFFALLAVGYVALRSVLLGTMVGGYGAQQHLNFSQSVIVNQALRSVLRVALPAFVLESATFLESRALAPYLIAFGALVLLCVAAALIRMETRSKLLPLARRHTLLWLMLAPFACCLLPFINLRLNVFDTQGERYLYLPSVFFSIALAYVLVQFGSRFKLRLAVFACVLIFYAATLWLANARWASTARLAQSLLSDITRQATRERIVVLNAPDNLKGAFLFRNGLEDALRIFQNERKITNVQVVAFHRLSSPDDEVAMTNDAGVISLRLVNEKTGFETFKDAPECVKMLEHSARMMRLRLDGCGESFEVFYFSEGRMRTIP